VRREERDDKDHVRRVHDPNLIHVSLFRTTELFALVTPPKCFRALRSGVAVAAVVVVAVVEGEGGDGGNDESGKSPRASAHLNFQSSEGESSAQSLATVGFPPSELAF